MDNLKDYVERARRRGVADERLRQALVSSGWDAKEVDDALSSKLSFPVKPMFFAAIIVLAVFAGYSLVEKGRYAGLFLLEPFSNEFVISHAFTGFISDITGDILTADVNGSIVKVYILNNTYIYNCTGDFDVVPTDKTNCYPVVSSYSFLVGKKAGVLVARLGADSKYKANSIFVKSDVK